MPKATLVGLVYNPKLGDTRPLLESLIPSLGLRGRSWISTPSDLPEHADRFVETSVVVVAGGDGTILRTVREVAPSGLPIVGINMGRVGFMSELTVEEAVEKLPSYLNGDQRVEERMMLTARVRAPGQSEESRELHALNDVVVARGNTVPPAGHQDDGQRRSADDIPHRRPDRGDGHGEHRLLAVGGGTDRVPRGASYHSAAGRTPHRPSPWGGPARRHGG